jgi:DNA-binding transcriptional regulator PaaX
MDDIDKKVEIYIDKNSWPLFGQIPIKLLRDPKIKLQPKALFGILHIYTYPKQLIGNPETTISLVTLSKDAGLTESNIRRWLKQLRDSGWIEIKRRGKTMTNRITLYGRSKAEQRKLEREMRKLNEIQYRLATDHKLAKRLNDSIKDRKQ